MAFFIIKFLAFIAFNLIIFGVWYLFCYKYISKYFTFVETVLCAFVLYLCQIIITQLFLGVVLHSLTWLTLLLLNVIVIVFLVPITKGLDYDKPLHEIKLKLAEFSNIIFRNKYIFLIFILFVITSVWLFFISFTFNDTSFNSQNYHLAFAGYVIQEQTIDVFNTSVSRINDFPKNIDLWYVWNLIFVQDDTLIDFAQYLFALIGILSLHSLLKKLNVRKPIALFSAILFFFIPLVILQSTTNYIDIAIASLFFAFLVFAFDDQITRVHVFVMGIIAGILVGAKAICLIWVLVGFLVFLYRVLKRGIGLPHKQMDWRRFLQVLGLFFGPLLILSFYWYLNNWVEFGSIIYPFSWSIGSFEIIAGAMPLSSLFFNSMPEVFANAPMWKTLLYNFYLPVQGYTYAMVPGGFGPLWAFGLFPMSVISVVVALIYDRKKSMKFFGVSLVFWVCLILTPANWWLRYVLFFAGWGVVGFGYLMSHDFSKKFKYIILGIILGLSIWSVYIAWWPADIDYKVLKTADFHSRDFSHGYGAVFEDLYKYTDAGTTIAYDSQWHLIYPLWNKELSNDVKYLSLNEWGGDVWMDRLREESVDLLAITTGSVEYKYVSMFPEKFELLTRNNGLRIYKVVGF